MDRAEKQLAVSTLHDTLKSAEVVVVAHYAGLTVAQMTELRRQMREAGASVQVAKNRLVKLALQGTDAEPISDLFAGQTLIATSGDPVSAPKVASEFAKKNDKLVILGGAMGTTILDTAGVNALATMPSLDFETSWQNRWCPSGTGNQDCPGSPGTGRTARARIRRICQEGRSGIRPFSNKIDF